MGPALLFCPADRPERYQKAAERADAVIVDLEDAVAPADKQRARGAILAQLGATGDVPELDPEPHHRPDQPGRHGGVREGPALPQAHPVPARDAGQGRKRRTSSGSWRATA